MAEAFLMNIHDVKKVGSEFRVVLNLFYTGLDVPGSFERQTIEVAITPGGATLGSQILQGIKNDAASRGYTVAAGATFAPQFQKV